MSGSIGIAREKVRKKEERRKKKEEGKTLPMVALSPTFTQTIPTDMISDRSLLPESIALRALNWEHKTGNSENKLPII